MPHLLLTTLEVDDLRKLGWSWEIDLNYDIRRDGWFATVTAPSGQTLAAFAVTPDEAVTELLRGIPLYPRSFQR